MARQRVELTAGGSATFPGPVLAASLPPALVEQLEQASHCLAVKCDFWKTCVFVSWCVFLFWANTALFIYFPWALHIEPSLEECFDRL